MAGDYYKDPEAISKLDDRQYAVTQNGATEPASDNVPYDELDAEGYGQHKELFDGPKNAEEAIK